MVFHIEMSNEDMVNAICKDTGSQENAFECGAQCDRWGFQSRQDLCRLMKPNVEALKEALN